MDKVISACFYRSDSGGEPVREWLLSLGREERKTIGSHVMTVEFGWPMGMPIVRKLEADLWEVRIRLNTKTARVLFTVKGRLMILLHGFMKQSQKTPQDDLETARQRMKKL